MEPAIPRPTPPPSALLRCDSGGATQDESRFIDDLLQWRLRRHHPADKQLDRSPTDVEYGLADGGQRRVEQLRADEIVKADEGHVVGDAHAEIANRLQRADRRQVVGRDDGRRRSVQVQQAGRARARGLLPEIAVDDQVRIDPQAASGQSSLIPALPVGQRAQLPRGPP